MKRFEITNPDNGMQFAYEADAAMSPQPEWGPNAVITVTDLGLAPAWDALRAARDQRLASSDWTQLSDAPVDRAAWAAYRQALRDLPAMTVDPASPTWPAIPA